MFQSNTRGEKITMPCLYSATSPTAQHYKNHIVKAALSDNGTFSPQMFVKLLKKKKKFRCMFLNSIFLLNKYPQCLRSSYYQLNQYNFLLALSSNGAN